MGDRRFDRRRDVARPGARGKGVGLMQCGLGVWFLPRVIHLALRRSANWGRKAWRVMFLIGILPALLTFWIRTFDPREPSVWDARPMPAGAQRRESAGVIKARRLVEGERAIPDPLHNRWGLFGKQRIRPARDSPVFLMSLATTLAWWGKARAGFRPTSGKALPPKTGFLYGTAMGDLWRRSPSIWAGCLASRLPSGSFS